MDLYIKFENNDGIKVGSLPFDEPSIITLGDDIIETDISEYLNIIGEDNKINALPLNYSNACKLLSISGNDKLMIIPKQRLGIHFRDILRRLRNALCDIRNLDYLVTYMSIRKFLHGLSRAAVDREKLIQLIEKTDNSTVEGNLKSLLPDDSGDVSRINYTMSATSTGRLVVKSGPKILTAPAAARSCLKSRFVNGKILQIDIVSAEPKFALHQASVEPPYDVYDHISKNILDGSVTRKNVKMITLCALYGQSLKKLSKNLPPDIGARAVVRKTKEYFQHESLLTKLKYDHSMGNFRNAIGRPLPVEDNRSHLLVSHYLQSSTAEGSILMFSNFIETIGNKCIPLFVIHDALIVDSDKETSEKFLKQGSVPLYLGDWKFEASITLVSDS